MEIEYLTYKEVSELLTDKKLLISYLRSVGLLRSIKPFCINGCIYKNGSPRKMFEVNWNNNDGSIFRCRICRSKKSIRMNSYFNGSRLSLTDTFYIIWEYCLGSSSGTILSKIGISSSTLTDHLNFIRGIASTKLIEMNYKIGGIGVTVFVDESQIHKKRKNHVGRIIEKEC